MHGFHESVHIFVRNACEYWRRIGLGEPACGIQDCGPPGGGCGETKVLSANNVVRTYSNWRATSLEKLSSCIDFGEDVTPRGHAGSKSVLPIERR
jgi:hypothetical protein